MHHNSMSSVDKAIISQMHEKITELRPLLMQWVATKDDPKAFFEARNPMPHLEVNHPQQRGRPRKSVNKWQSLFVMLANLYLDMKVSEIKDAPMTDEQFAVYMKDAAPKLMKRSIEMALVSDDLKAVRAVAADVADRGYGKAASQLNINIGEKDVRRAWIELEERKAIDVVPIMNDAIANNAAIEYDKSEEDENETGV